MGGVDSTCVRREVALLPLDGKGTRVSHSIAVLFPIPGHAGRDKALHVFVHVHKALIHSARF